MLRTGVAIGLLLFLPVVINRRGAPAAVMYAFLCSTLLLSDIFVTLVPGDDLVSTTLAAPDIELHVYHVVIIAILLVVPRVLGSRHVSVPLLMVPVALFAIAVFQNDLPVHVASGLIQWVFAVLAWPIGSWLAEQRVRGTLTDRTMAAILLVPVGVDAVAVLQQLTGARGGVGSVADGAGSTIERVTGLEGHSGNLGKVLLLIFVLAIPLANSVDRTTRRLTMVNVGLIFVLTGLTYSRANVAAIGVALVLWFVLRPGGGALRRLTVPFLVVGASFPFVVTLLQRNAFDPNGGSRPILTAAAWQQIRLTFWFGVGPNNYQNVVGRFSQISLALPVHNTFLLTLAEAGFLVTLVIAYPLLRVAFGALSSLRAGGLRGSQAVAFAAITPGLLLVLLTGHGLVTDHIMLLFFLILGYCHYLYFSAPRAVAVRPAPLVVTPEHAVTRTAVAKRRARALDATGSRRVPVGAGAGARPAIASGTSLPDALFADRPDVEAVAAARRP